ncbi:hypothetical protein [Pectobacterium odoriferum]|nr:hypothetical protein [Pectobacterium odoriferum]
MGHYGVFFAVRQPDSSLSRHRSGQQGRSMRAIYPYMLMLL